MDRSLVAPVLVHRTIVGAFFRYRGLRRVFAAPAAVELTDDDVISEMEQFDFLRIDAERVVPRGKRTRVVFLILSRSGKYAKFSPDLKQLLKTIESERMYKDGLLDELIIVADDTAGGSLKKKKKKNKSTTGDESTDSGFFQRKKLTDVILKWQASEAPREPWPAESGDLAGAAPYFSAYPYHIFALVVPEHVAVYPHRVMGHAEVAELLRREQNGLRDYPVILDTDPPVVWAGGRPGQVVEITRDSHTAIRAIAYRRIERASLAAM